MPPDRHSEPLTVELREHARDGDQRRRAIRHTVLAQVVWDHRSSEGESGEILDISSMGLFMSADSGLSEDLKVGDLIWGVLRIGDFDRPFAGTIRWRGYSHKHGRPGIGVEFNDGIPLPSDLLARFLARHILKSSR